MSGDTKIEISGTPKATDSYYIKKKEKLFCKRAGIEPVMGHLKSDHRLSRNFYKGLFGDSTNVMLAAAAKNFKRAMKTLFYTIFKLVQVLEYAIWDTLGLCRIYIYISTLSLLKIMAILSLIPKSNLRHFLRVD